VAIKGTLVQALINSHLPEPYRISGQTDKGTLKRSVLDYARTDPAGYAASIARIKEVGDSVATFEGISVGLDDIAPDYAKRDAIVRAVQPKLRASKSSAEYTKHLLNTQDKFLSLTEKHQGDMGLMARSGGRGSTAQLMKTTTGQALVGDFDGKPVPYFIQRSYAEGLSPAEAWVTGDESRSQVIKGNLGTADPGELGKLLATMMSGQVVSATDCGTTNGIMVKPDDSSILGRYRAGTSRLIDTRERSALMRSKQSVMVRSPMTCEAPHGVCQKCQGAGTTGADYSIGDNVGIRASQVMAEPLTQMTLSAEHGVSLVEGKDDDVPGGLAAVRQFLEIPSSFSGKAALARKKGRVTAVQEASQGGWNVDIEDERHYISPKRMLAVKEGDRLEAGDVLTNGIPAPNEVVAFKGMGAGRKYIVDSFQKLYKDQGHDVDPRHFELMAKAHLNAVEVRSPFGDHLPGDVISYNEARRAYKAGSSMVNLQAAQDKILSEAALHYTAGTRVTSQVSDDLKRAGFKTVSITPNPPKLTAVMKSASRVPLLNPNWMERLSHRYQKANLMQAAQHGESSDLHGNNPYSAIVFGKELGRKPDGSY